MRLILPANLEPDYPKSAGEPEQRADLEPPLANDVAFLWKKNEGKERGEDNRRAPKDGVNARAHVKQSEHLCDLMHDVWDARSETNSNGVPVDLQLTSPEPTQDKRRDCQTGDEIAIKILRPDVIIAIEKELEERRKRPDDDGGKDSRVTFGKIRRIWLIHYRGIPKRGSDATEALTTNEHQWTQIQKPGVRGQKSDVRRRQIPARCSPIIFVSFVAFCYPDPSCVFVFIGVH